MQNSEKLKLWKPAKPDQAKAGQARQSQARQSHAQARPGPGGLRGHGKPDNLNFLKKTPDFASKICLQLPF